MNAMDVSRLLARSLGLDIRFARSAVYPPRDTAAFIAKKYALLLRHTVRPFVFGTDSVRVGARDYFYESRFGLAAYQGALISHLGALQAAGATEVKTVLDVGANIGYFALAMRQAYPHAVIHCFEPVPAVGDVLRANHRDDSGVILHRVALAGESGEARMAFDGQDSLISRLDSSGDLLVKTQTLDSFVIEAGIETVDVLKIDTETFEDAVLDGARETLSRTRYLFLEITIKDNARYTVSSLLARLYSTEFNFQLVSGRNFSGRAEGPVPILDALLVNTHLVPV